MGRVAKVGSVERIESVKRARNVGRVARIGQFSLIYISQNQLDHFSVGGIEG